MTNIEQSIQNALGMLNGMRKIGIDKHVHGRLLSKIQTSYIILFTDGGKMSNLKKVYSGSSKVNLHYENFNPNLINEPFRWDYQLVNLVLGQNPDTEGIKLLRKMASIIGGQTVTIENMDDLMIKIENICDKICHKVNIFFEVNNKIINSITSALNTSGSNKIKFANKSSFSKILTSINVDFRFFKSSQIISASETLIFDRQENISFREKWPLPDELLMNKNLKSLQSKKAQPTYIISNELRFDFDVHRMEYDEFELSDREFLLKFLENYPDLKFSQLSNDTNAQPFSNNTKITWDLYILLNNSDNIPKQPFGVLKLTIPIKIQLENLEENLSILEYLRKHENNEITFKLCVLPYNFREYFAIIKNFEKNLIGKSEFIIQIEKYMMKIPFYYKPYNVVHLEKKGFWKLDDCFFKTLEEDNLSETVFSQIKQLSNEDTEKLIEANKLYNQGKQLHLNKNANCCGFHVFKTLNVNISREREYNPQISTTKEEFSEFLSNCSDFNNFMKKKNKNFDNYSKVCSNNFEIEIDLMGDFREFVSKINNAHKLRPAYILEKEIKVFKGDYFGNPFIDPKKILTGNEINFKLDNPNINIKDGESLLLNLNSDATKNRKLLDDELSVFPKDESNTNTNAISTDFNNKKRKRKDIIDNENNALFEKEALYELNSPSSTSTAEDFDLQIYSPNTNKLQLQIIDDDITNEFKNIFNKISLQDRNGLKINNKISINMNTLYDWKLKDKLKEVSNTIIHNLRTNKSVIPFIEDLLNKPFLFFTDEQKNNFLKKIKNMCQIFGTNKMIVKYINKKINY